MRNSVIMERSGARKVMPARAEIRPSVWRRRQSGRFSRQLARGLDDLWGAAHTDLG